MALSGRVQMRGENAGSSFRMTPPSDMVQSERHEEAEPSRRQMRTIFVFVACLCIGFALGCSTGIFILIDARLDSPEPHGGMYAALGAWLIFIPLGTIAGAIVGLAAGIWIRKRRR